MTNDLAAARRRRGAVLAFDGRIRRAEHLLETKRQAHAALAQEIRNLETQVRGYRRRRTSLRGQA